MSLTPSMRLRLSRVYAARNQDGLRMESGNVLSETGWRAGRSTGITGRVATISRVISAKYFRNRTINHDEPVWRFLDVYPAAVPEWPAERCSNSAYPRRPRVVAQIHHCKRRMGRNNDTYVARRILQHQRHPGKNNRPAGGPLITLQRTTMDSEKLCPVHRPEPVFGSKRQPIETSRLIPVISYGKL